MLPTIILASILFIGPAPTPEIAAPPRSAEPPGAEWVAHRLTTRGEVTAADETSVTVRGFDLRYTSTGRRNVRLVSVGGRPPLLYTECDETRHELTLTLANGDVATFRRADMPTRRFTASPGLLDGSRVYAKAHSYRPADIRVGDEVRLAFLLDPAGDEEVFWGLRIERRPGGRVPPAPIPNVYNRDPWHERANAYQDWEERGIPLPDKYDPEKSLEDVRRTAEAVRRFQAEAEAKQAARERLFRMVREMKSMPPAP